MIRDRTSPDHPWLFDYPLNTIGYLAAFVIFFGTGVLIRKGFFQEDQPAWSSAVFMLFGLAALKGALHGGDRIDSHGQRLVRWWGPVPILTRWVPFDRVESIDLYFLSRRKRRNDRPPTWYNVDGQHGTRRTRLRVLGSIDHARPFARRVADLVGAPVHDAVEEDPA